MKSNYEEARKVYESKTAKANSGDPPADLPMVHRYPYDVPSVSSLQAQISYEKARNYHETAQLQVASELARFDRYKAYEMVVPLFYSSGLFTYQNHWIALFSEKNVGVLKEITQAWEHFLSSM